MPGLDHTRFLLVHDGLPGDPAVAGVAALLGVELARRIGGTRAAVPAAVVPATFDDLDASLDAAVADGGREIFLAAARLGLDLARRERLAGAARDLRRRHGDVRVAYGEPDPCDPLVVLAAVDRISAAATPMSVDHLGLLVVAGGDGDSGERARAYALMRLIWEQVRAAHAEVAFVRHDRPGLVAQLAACRSRGLRWVLAPAFLWRTPLFEYMQVIHGDIGRRDSDVASWPVAEPLGAHPAIGEWLLRQLLALWHEKRRDDRARRPSARRRPEVRGAGTVWGPAAGGLVADIADPAELAPLLADAGLGLAHLPTVIKVTWHGYAPGTYTDPRALDALLGALPGPAIIIEGHTASRNRGAPPDLDWERESAQHRAWIADEDREFRERTGLARVLAARGATYLNVTEAWWDGACAPAEQVRAYLVARGVELVHSELYDYVPATLFALAGARFISFARMKGPTRLGLANLFGLIPVPLRAAWHGPNITYFARVCCDLARLWGTLFDAYGIVESLDVAVRWTPRGLYRSRWGNYDLIHRPGLVCLSRGLVTADVLACRLQGQEVGQSAFYDVVRAELGLPAEAESLALDPDLCARLA